jgi:hypothetical protein
VDEDESQPRVADLAVKLQQRVLAERRRQRPKARHEHELQPHHRQADEPERDREVGPEPVVRLARTDHRERQRRQHRAEIGDHPEHRADGERHRRSAFVRPLPSHVANHNLRAAHQRPRVV